MKISCAIVLQLLAVWPTLRWYFSRVNEQNFFCLIPLVALGYFLSKEKQQNVELASFHIRSSTMLLLLYGLIAWLKFPPIIMALVAVLSLTVLLSMIYRKRWHWGIFCLLTLSLPIMASLQFFAGYPLRLLATQGTSLLLNAGGVAVSAQGATLDWYGQQIVVDAPCSGINMLWSGLLLSSILGYHHYLMSWRFCMLQFIALLVIVAGNTLRATSLFYVEKSPVVFPEFTHQGIGVVMFILVSVVILYFSEKVRSWAWPQKHTS